MPELVAVARIEEVPVGTVRSVEVAGRLIALCNFDGAIYAIDDVCTHDGGSLDQGELVGSEIECPRHGARFDVKTGRATRLPAIRPVRSYRVEIDGGSISVEV